MSEPYEPVDCSFHDVLEDAAVLRRSCRIRYRAEDGSVVEETTTIQDVFSRDGAEYARLGTGALVRLDRLDLVDPGPAQGRGLPPERDFPLEPGFPPERDSPLGADSP